MAELHFEVPVLNVSRIARIEEFIRIVLESDIGDLGGQPERKQKRARDRKPAKADNDTSPALEALKSGDSAQYLRQKKKPGGPS